MAKYIPKKLSFMIKKIIRTPFQNKNEKRLIIHACYHKVGTVWFKRIFQPICDYYGLNFQKYYPNDVKPETDFFLDDHSLIDLSKFQTYRGSHMIRDPRDIVISGYFYHKKTKEEWVHIPLKEYNNMTYQDYLKSLDQEQGILAEIKRVGKDINHMTAWDYNNLNILEIRYEDIITDEEKYFTKIFQHYQFNREAIAMGLEIVNKVSIKNKTPKLVSKSSHHVRSGKPGEWQTYFTEKHKEYFKLLCGDSLVSLGYENKNTW